jgi:putative Mg2+ transporter-C (MgtC) family protein
MVKFAHPKPILSRRSHMNVQPLVELKYREISSGAATGSLVPVLVATLLGGLIGLERELKHRAAGLRTTRFIGFGAAWFPVRSQRLAGVFSDAAGIAAPIIPGSGFIDAGSILPLRGLTTGLTTAAPLFVVASVGMAAGGGLYLTALFATGLVLLSLFLLGHLEETFSLKLLCPSYEVTGAGAEEISNEVTRILESQHRLMQNVATGNTGQPVRLQFDVEGCNRGQEQLRGQLKASMVLGSVAWLGRVERE